jgi:hypothetical protein
MSERSPQPAAPGEQTNTRDELTARAGRLGVAVDGAYDKYLESLGFVTEGQGRVDGSTLADAVWQGICDQSLPPIVPGEVGRGGNFELHLLHGKLGPARPDWFGLQDYTRLEDGHWSLALDAYRPLPEGTPEADAAGEEVFVESWYFPGPTKVSQAPEFEASLARLEAAVAPWRPQDPAPKD